MRRLGLALVSALLLTVVALPGVSSAQKPLDAVSTFETTKNMKPIGYSERSVPFVGTGSGVLNSDLAFWGDWAIEGHYAGFRIIDVSEPGEPVEIVNYQDCVSPTSAAGSQGDVLVYEDTLIRTWDAPAGATATCDGQLVGQGFEGLHIFDISDPTDPSLIGSVPLAAFGALPHTVTIHSGSAAGDYPATGAAFGTPPTVDGLTGSLVAVNDGVEGEGTPPGTLTDGCEPYTLPAGSIALVDRGFCGFVVKAALAQAAGASAMIVVNNAAGNPITMGGADPSVTITSVMVSQAAGAAIRAGDLPVDTTIKRNPNFHCGSHTASMVPDLENDRLLVYNSSSAGGACDFFEIIEVPLDDPGSAALLKSVDSMHTCHDIGIILGDANRLACAGGGGARIFSLDEDDGAALDDPVLMHHFDIPGVTIGHSAAWTWDGEVVVFGHEPGGGGQAQCQATSSIVNRSLFFFDHEGNQLGSFVLPRPQTNTENCTWHNYNVVPTSKRYVLVSGNYQSGISVVDFTDPANAKEIAFADPAPLVHPTNPNAIVTGGDWSSYWYNGFIYESDIRRGLIIWKLSDSAVAGARMFPYSNPQTQPTSFSMKFGG